MTPPVRVRIAPAPSGSLHVGNARTALFNWLFARHHGGSFVLRVEDTDRERVKDEYVDAVMSVLRWLGLDWDEGPEVGGPGAPYRQSERTERYAAALERLSAAGHTYPCYCTPDELAERRDAARKAGRFSGYDGTCRELTAEQCAAFEAEGRQPVTRFRIPDGETVVNDLVRGEARFDHAQIEDFVLARRDGSVLYTLAAATDDMEMGISHVIRGEDLFSSTPKQIMLITALGGDAPQYAHLPLLVGPDRQKLSKRHGDVSVEHYREAGMLPEAMLNYMALLGWSPGDGVTERFTTDELIKLFDIGGVSRNPAAFDPDKLRALNGEKIRALPPADLAARIEPLLIERGVLPAEPSAAQRDLLAAAVPLIQERMGTLNEGADQLPFLFGEIEPDDKARKMLGDEHRPALEAAARILEGLEPFSAEAIQEALGAWADEAGIKRKFAFQPVRAAVTGRLVSPPLFESLELLGREASLARIRAALA